MNNDVQHGHPEKPGGLEPMDDLLARARDVVGAVVALSGEPDLASRSSTDGPRAAETTLVGAEQLFVDELAHAEDRVRRAQLAATLAQVGGLLTRLREARLVARSAAMTDVQQSLNRLRSTGSFAELLERVPLEVHRLGYRRGLFSLLAGRDWTARSAYADDDPQLARALVEIGTAIPGRLGRELPETEVVRTRRPVLVEDAQHNPRVHHRLVNLSGTPDYVVTPLIGRGDVIGLVHADRHGDAERMDAFDERLLGLFTEGLGCLFERAVFAEQLRRLRRQLTEQADSVGELLNGVGEFSAPEPTAPMELLPTTDGPLAELTRREQEVLRHLVRGQTNSQIAETLFISPGTVKTHVKNVLRKLGLTNRSEAAARYHSLITR